MVVDLWIRNFLFGPDNKSRRRELKDRSDSVQAGLSFLTVGFLVRSGRSRRNVSSECLNATCRKYIPRVFQECSPRLDLRKGIQGLLSINESGDDDVGVTGVEISPDGRFVAAGPLDTLVRT